MNNDILMNASASISAREFAILRHGLRYITAAMDAGSDFSPSGVDRTDVLALDYKLGNIIEAAKAKTSQENDDNG